MLEDDNLLPTFVIILNWNLAEDTIECVKSVQYSSSHTRKQTRIVIVDNGSTDDSVSRFHAAFGASVDIVETKQNLGFAGGMNVGMRYALKEGAGSVLLLNNDTVVEEGMVSALVRTAMQMGDNSIVAPLIYFFAAPETLWKVGDQESAWLPIPLNVSAKTITQTQHEPLSVDYVTGCCMLIPRHILQNVGLFDERFFMYFEDADFCRRVRDAGFTIHLAPQAKMWHKVSLSAKKDRPGQRYWRTWGRVQFYRQHDHGQIPLLKHPYLWGLALYTMLLDILRGDRNLIMPLLAGMLDGYAGTNTRRKYYFQK